ncbi:MAG TPA: hypothetical protein VN703_02385 [Candidatus Sulfopaludibacter sp.]|nr:hypothetical protein [Candidatus Sulfopaludibacter sp.]
MTDEYNNDKRELKKDAHNAADDAHSTLGDASNKIQAGAKAVANKIKDPNKDTGTEYDKEKLKEELD